MEAGGAELLLICTNTMHKVADQVQAAVGIPLLHIADVTADAVLAAGLDTVGVARHRLHDGADVLSRAAGAARSHRADRPAAADRAEVHRIIYDELCLGVIREESREVYRGVIARLVAAGAQGVILGCTEIELLVSAADSPVPVFATTRLHAEAAVLRPALAPARSGVEVLS